MAFKTKTWEVIDGRISGKIDGIDAIAQAVDKLFQTELYKYAIYNRDYGISLKHLLGQPVEYVRTMLPKFVKQAIGHNQLLKDKITYIDGYTFRQDSNNLYVNINFHTIYGETNYSAKLNKVGG